MPTKLAPGRFVRAVLQSFMQESGLEPRLFGRDHIRINRAVEGEVDFELDIQQDHTNRLKILHGGTIASMVDLGGSLAVASKGLYATGVSTDLNVTYLRSGGKIEDTIQAKAVCEKIGRNLAFTNITFRTFEGALVARGSHTKYVADAWKAQQDRGLWTVPEDAVIDESTA